MGSLADFKHALPGVLYFPSGPTTLALTLILFLTVIGVCIYRVWFHPLAAFPGPARYAVTELPQNIESMIRGTWFRRTTELHRRYGPVVRVGPNSLSVDGSVGWPQVFGHQPGGIEFGKVTKFFGANNSENIISAPREAHRRQRRHLAHAFSEAALAEQQEFVLKYVDILISKIAEQAHEGQRVNVVDWMNFLTFDIIGDLAFGDAFHSMDHGDYHPWVRIVTDSLPGFALNRFVDHYPALRPVFPFVADKRFIDQMRTMMSISENKAEARISQGEKPGRHDFMTYVNRKTRDGQEGMTPREKHLTGPLLIVAGSETTSTALAGAFFFLGHHPEALARLQAEVRAAYTSEADVNMKNVAQLPYLMACIEETLRLYPPAVEVAPRVSPGAEVEGKYVPKGTTLTVNSYATFRNPAHFTDPDTFKPERWLPSTHSCYDARYAGDNHAAFRPFSYGPRDCIGKNLANMEMRITLACLNLRFDWTLVPDQAHWQRDQTVLSTWKKTPLWVIFTERTDGAIAPA